VEKILKIASYAHTYVVCEQEKIIGTGSISSYWGSESESILLTIFVLPEYQSKGIGREIIHALEQDELFLRAKRIGIPASITACGFYEKMGYQYKDGLKKLDAEGHYLMEKKRY
jgi:GNAT superfamily N-acetyltransferase